LVGIWIRRVVATVLVAVGGVWIAQGTGALGGSFMTGEGFWTFMGVGGLVVRIVLYFLLPPSRSRTEASGSWKTVLASFKVVFRNPQSILCGAIAGLLFIPTTIFDMVWGVRYLQEANGFEYGSAVMRSAMVPLGWMIGCPLLGFISDRIGRRKPVIVVAAFVLLGVLAWILYGPVDLLPPYVLGLVAGTASGAAMLPYTVIKEANPPEASGTATGVVNFLNFTFSALLGPVFGWILASVSGGAATMTRAHYQETFDLLLYGVGVAIVLTVFLRETGPSARRTALAIPVHEVT